MIYDRVKADVDAAVLLRNTKVKAFEELTDDELETLERGTLTINTLNRIEQKQEQLKELLNAMGYWNTNFTNVSWAFGDLFDTGDFSRILSGLTKLRNGFFTYNDTPKTPNISYYFEDINSIEKILHDIEIMVDDVKSRYRKCGTFQCGEENAL